jgi:hypothetical protein
MGIVPLDVEGAPASACQPLKCSALRGRCSPGPVPPTDAAAVRANPVVSSHVTHGPVGTPSASTGTVEDVLPGHRDRRHVATPRPSSSCEESTPPIRHDQRATRASRVLHRGAAGRRTDGRQRRGCSWASMLAVQRHHAHLQAHRCRGRSLRHRSPGPGARAVGHGAIGSEDCSSIMSAITARLMNSSASSVEPADATPP